MILDSTYIRSFFIILISLVALLGLLVVGRGLSQAHLHLPILLTIGLVIFIASFFNSRFALYMLVFSMLLSPEIVISQTKAREVTVRTDDFLLALVTFTWLARMAINKELGALRETAINALLLAYIAVCAFSTALGVLIGNVSPLSGFFFVLKFSEYFLVYFMVVNLLDSKQQARKYIIAMLVTCAIVSLYGMLQIPAGRRVTAPFEGEEGEPGTFGGYLVLMMSVALAFLVYSEETKKKAIFGGLCVLFLLPLLYTLSRASFMALVPMFLVMLYFSRRKKLLVSLLVFALITGPFLVPQRIIERVKYTFEEQREGTEIGSISLEASASARIESWRRVIKRWPKRPILGHGVTGFGFIDGQYPRVLAETGTVGLFVFLFLLWRIFSSSLSVYRTEKDQFSQALSLSLIAGFSGLVTHAMTANTFIIVRIMEPFWFLTGIVMRLPDLEDEEKARKPESR